ncbi:Ig-like domain-containing protein [Aliiglaciecola sp. CAU 1673]|uniref:Ig-like domain-containing protein n=1 Tax=Aliiglaciecola sp. CAU 1673 TaxID=3032595 RepID=UPI0023DB0371|nr:Ig-like domain-containing protein [Aliiglaciecola sp. CAU 1673]MDF2179092.1 Ig-like domain-containing protein [Aliiglaciecola sp. CAU 1673]
MKNVIMVLLLAMGLAACGSGEGEAPAPEPTSTIFSVEVTPVDISLLIGESKQLTATVRDSNGTVVTGKAVTWQSTDSQKATVSANGLVTAMANGEVKITASLEGKNAKSKVKVSAPPSQPVVASVVINTDFEYLEEGDSLQLEAKVFDQDGNQLMDRAISWVSTDPNTISVSASGYVTSLKLGQAKIFASSEEVQSACTIETYAEYAYELIYGRQDVAQPAELYSLDINSSLATPQQLFAPGRQASHGSASPDGQKVAFVVYPTNVFWESRIMIADRHAQHGYDFGLDDGTQY